MNDTVFGYGSAVNAGLARLMPATAQAAPPVHLPGLTGQVQFADEHGHDVTAYRRGRANWVLDSAAHNGNDVLSFWSTRQLRGRSQAAVKVAGAPTC